MPRDDDAPTIPYPHAGRVTIRRVHALATEHERETAKVWIERIRATMREHRERRTAK